eukprot:133232_1
MTFSKLHKLSTYFNDANYYKQKYDALLNEIQNEKRNKEINKRKQDAINKLYVIQLKRKEQLKCRFNEWRLIKNLAKFKKYCKINMKQRYFKNWRRCYDQNMRWELESKIDSLENALSRKKVYNEIYVGQNGELVNQLTQYKEAIAICVDAASRNDTCNVCASLWYKKFAEYLDSIKLRHTFIKDLL